MLAVFDREREKVNAFARRLRADRRDQKHRVAVADDYRAVGLFGDPSGLDRKLAVAQFNLLFEILLRCHMLFVSFGHSPSGLGTAARRLIRLARPLMLSFRAGLTEALREATSVVRRNHEKNGTKLQP
jgi:hypothetical protein